MKKPILLFLLFFFLSIISVMAQSASIRGRLVDSADKKSLENSVIALLREKDSTLVNFTRAKQNGSFEFSVPDTGRYLLMATHPYFADFVDSIIITKGQIIDAGTIQLFSKIKMLEEIVVKGNRKIFMKGDTTVFTADSFKVREGANVEELLKKLPGIQVDKKGQIKAMGENVKKVLVDGEEFFGTDPGIATKNLRADIVKEVEVFDKRSDQSAFTGIDDGVKDKTINLKLKDDKKKGMFGKIDAGGGYKDRFYGAGMLNAFKKKRKFAAYGIASNTGWMNLSWDDRDKFGGGNNMEVMEDGGIMIWTGSDDYNNSEGIPTNYNGGLHYSDKYNQDKNSLNTGYKYARIDAPGNSKTFSKNYPPDSSWTSNSENSFANSTQKHAANLTFESKLDSINTIKLTTAGNLNYSKNSSSSFTDNINDKNGSFINRNVRNESSNNHSSGYNANLLWMHKFKKPFRTISVNTSFKNNDNKNDALTYSKIDFYKNNIVDSAAVVDQNTLVNNNSLSFDTKIAYTEPLAKDVYLETNYTFGLAKRSNNRDVFIKGTSGKYDQHVDSLSNRFDYNDITHRPGLNFRYAKKNLNIRIGTSVGFVSNEQFDKTKNMRRPYSFNNYYPSASFRYKIKPSEFIGFDYNGNSTAPSIDQLQPIRDNTNQLYQVIGNPDLLPSFRHSFSANYSFWKSLTEKSLWLRATYSFTQNTFANVSRISNAVTTSQTVNTDGEYNANVYAYYDMKIKKWNINLSFNPDLGMNRSVDFIGGFSGDAKKNYTTNTDLGLRIRLSKEKDKKYDIALAPNVHYNIAKATINDKANAKYWSGGFELNATVFLPKNFEIENNIEAQLRQKDPRFPTNNNFIFWNAEIRKKLLKDKLTLKFIANDILDQRSGYNRSFDSYSFRESYRTVLKRHFLIGIIWNFNHSNMGGNEASK